ncbi:hypothetical protein F4779DRAFT_613220 [Xylariaceae sp. FL0662B]|nr:hypothetical protein F4779DRAFT_613220 [Xylariaceae sp. FL0662B]
MAGPSALRPIRHVFARPLAQQSRNALAGFGFVSARSQSSSVDEKASPPQLVNELPDRREENEVRLPRAVQALYLQPLRREPEYGVPSCDLQLRSFSIPNLEFFCDFALRAAYFLKLPAFGPVPLPRIVERWTVPRSHFIFKKSQENFERVTRRRLIQIRDGHPETVQIWLAYLQKHAYYGIGMKANMWEFSSLNTAKHMDDETKSMQEILEQKMQHLGRDRALGTVEKILRLGTHQQQRRQQRRHFSDDSQAAEAGAWAEAEAEPKRENAVIFSGIQPTGVPHLGNYLGAMRQWKRLQDSAGEGDRLFFSIVDLHAITTPRNAFQLRTHKRELLATLLAIGLDPDRSTLFFQSSVPAHTELMWILSCTASMGYLSRMTQWKSKLQMHNKAAEDLDEAAAARLKLGLFSYPVLQAADILVHRATHVPVGDDQKQHLEFARECATNFNATFDPTSRGILVAPETITTPTPRVMSLMSPESKMSKSSPNFRSWVSVIADAVEIRSRIRGAVTDMYNAVTYDPVARPGVANLLWLLSQCGPDQRPVDELAAELDGRPIKVLKDLVADAVVRELDGVRDRYRDALDRKGGKYLLEVEAEGAEVARRSAEETMVLVRDAVGLGGLRVP